MVAISEANQEESSYLEDEDKLFPIAHGDRGDDGFILVTRKGSMIIPQNLSTANSTAAASSREDSYAKFSAEKKPL
jgi:hypothetical protein